MTAQNGGGGILARIGLGTREQRAWAMYDWANSAYFTTVVVAVFPAFFNRVVAADLAEGEATRRLSLATSVGMAIVALSAPVLGALADRARAKKKLLAAFAVLGIAATSLMFFLGPGSWMPALVLLVVGNVGVAGSILFSDALLPSIAKPEEVDRVSTAGYSLGYLGGGLLLALNFAWIKRPDLFGLPHGDGLSDAEATLPARLALLSVAVWWAMFTLPILRRVAEPKTGAAATPPAEGGLLSGAVRQTWSTLRELRGYRQAVLLLLAVLVYGEGIGTIIKLSGSYAADLELEEGVVLSAFLLTQFIGIPCALLFGLLASWIGARRSVYVTLVVYCVVCVFAYFMEKGASWQFFVMAILIGTVQGGAQALGRSLFASVIPEHKAAEFFGLFTLGSKFAGTIGPALFWVIGTATDSNRLAILSLVGFFVLGGFLLSRVDLEEGRRAVRSGAP